MSKRGGAVSTAEAQAAEAATGTSQEARFTLELEFVMSLANPRYLHRASPPMSQSQSHLALTIPPNHQNVLPPAPVTARSCFALHDARLTRQ
jgi:hypothetical protein